MRVGQRQPETVFFVSGCLRIFSQRTACQQAVGARGKRFRLPNHYARV